MSDVTFNADILTSSVTQQAPEIVTDAIFSVDVLTSSVTQQALEIVTIFPVDVLTSSVTQQTPEIVTDAIFSVDVLTSSVTQQALEIVTIFPVDVLTSSVVQQVPVPVVIKYLPSGGGGGGGWSIGVDATPSSSSTPLKLTLALATPTIVTQVNKTVDVSVQTITSSTKDIITHVGTTVPTNAQVISGSTAVPDIVIGVSTNPQIISGVVINPTSTIHKVVFADAQLITSSVQTCVVSISKSVSTNTQVITNLVETPNLINGLILVNGDGTIGGWTTNTGGTTNLYQCIDEGTNYPDDSDYVKCSTVNSACYFTLRDMPVNFDHAVSVTIKIRCKRTDGTGDYRSLHYVQIVENDEVTAITDVEDITDTVNITTYSATPVIIGNTDKTTWDSAKLKIITNTTGTVGSVYVYAVQLEIQYSIGTTTSIIAASGGDYTTLQSWFYDKNNFIGHHIAQLKTGLYAGLDTSTSLPTSSIDYFEIQAYQDETNISFKGIFNDSAPNYPIIYAAPGKTYCIDIAGQDSFTISGVVFYQHASSAIMTAVYGAGENTLIENCGFDIETTYIGSSTCTVSGVYCNNGTAYSWTIRNCIFRNISATSTNPFCPQTIAVPIFIMKIGTPVGYLNVYQCVINKVYCSTAGGYQYSNGIIAGWAGEGLATATVYNTYFCRPVIAGTGTPGLPLYVNYGDVLLAETNDAGYNAIEVGGVLANTTGQRTDIVAADEFKNTTLATFDAHLKPLSSFKNAGLDISAKPLAPINDIDGELWMGQWNIGVDGPPTVLADSQTITSILLRPTLIVQNVTLFPDAQIITASVLNADFSTVATVNSQIITISEQPITAIVKPNLNAQIITISSNQPDWSTGPTLGPEIITASVEPPSFNPSISVDCQVITSKVNDLATFGVISVNTQILVASPKTVTHSLSVIISPTCQVITSSVKAPKLNGSILLGPQVITGLVNDADFYSTKRVSVQHITASVLNSTRSLDRIVSVNLQTITSSLKNIRLSGRVLVDEQNIAITLNQPTIFSTHRLSVQKIKTKFMGAVGGVSKDVFPSVRLITANIKNIARKYGSVGAATQIITTTLQSPSSSVVVSPGVQIINGTVKNPNFTIIVYPDGDGPIQATPWTTDTGSTTGLYECINEGTDNPDDNDYIQSPLAVSLVPYYCSLDNMPAGLNSVLGVTLKIRLKQTAVASYQTYVQIVESDFVTAVTDVATINNATNFTTFSLTPNINPGETTKDIWDNAYLKITTSASTDAQVYVSAVQVEVQHESTPDVVVLTDVNIITAIQNTALVTIKLPVQKITLLKLSPTVYHTRQVLKKVGVNVIKILPKKPKFMTTLVSQGGAEGAGKAVISKITLMSPSGGAESSGEAVIDTSGYAPHGGAEGGGNATGGSRFSITKDFTYNTGQCIEYYWQIEGACTPSSCFYNVGGKWLPLYENGSLGGDSCLRQLIVIEQGCDLKEVCQKLSARNFDFPIARIARFTQPVNTTEEFSGCATYEQVYPNLLEGSVEFEIPVDCLSYFTSGTTQSIWGGYFTVEWSGTIIEEAGIELGTSGSIMQKNNIIQQDEDDGIILGTDGYTTFVGEFTSTWGDVESTADLVGDFPLETGSDLVDEIVVINGECSCGVISSRVDISHNLNSSKKLSLFLKRNNFVLPSVVSLYYNTLTAAWQNNTHFMGWSDDNITKESWNIIFDWSCVDSVATIPLGSVWKLSIYIKQKNLTTNEDFDTRVLLVFEPTYVCPDQSDLDYTFSLNTELLTTTVEGRYYDLNVNLNICTDNANLFKSPSWLADPLLKIGIHSNEFLSNYGVVDYSNLLIGT
jgi:hypothetical protein